MMLGEMIVPTPGSSRLVSNSIGEDFGKPISTPMAPVEQTKVVNMTTSIGTGHIVLLGLLGLFLLRGAGK